MQCDRPQPDDGFATLESLVAFVILSIVLAVASQSIVLSVRSLVAATQQRDMMETVRVLIAERTDDLKTSNPQARSEKTHLETVEVDEERTVAVWIRGGKRPILTFLPRKRQ